MKRLIFIILCGFRIYEATAGGYPFPAGARSAGMGNTSVTSTDLWSSVNNPSGLAGLNTSVFGIHYSNFFGIKSFSYLNAAGSISYKDIRAAINISRFGNDDYNEGFLGFSIAHKIRNVSLGLKADLFQLMIAEQRTIHKLIISFGGQAELSKEVSFGAYVYNLNQVKLGKDLDERIPVLMKLGIQWKPSSRVSFSFEAEKNVRYPLNWKGGIEYAPVNNFWIRTGINTSPSRAFFGAGIRKYNFELSYATGVFNPAGSTNHLTLNYFFK